MNWKIILLILNSISIDPPSTNTSTTTNNNDNYDELNLKGVIMNQVADGLKVCCRNNVTTSYEEQFHDIANMVEASMNSSLDIILPIRSSVGKDLFIAFPFIGLGWSF